MANIRFVLFIILAFMCFSLWQQWQLDYGPKPPQPIASDTPGASTTPAKPGDTPPVARTPDEVAGADPARPETLTASANRGHQSSAPRWAVAEQLENIQSMPFSPMSG